MVALPRTFDPTPTSIVRIIDGLPAAARERIEWFPPAFRSAFVEPLRAAPPERFRAVVDELTVGAVRLFMALFANLREVTSLCEADFIAPAADPTDRDLVLHQRIADALEPIEVRASDDLREAHEILRAVFAATSIEIRAPLEEVGDTRDLIGSITDDQIRIELGGGPGSFWRGMLLTAGGVELVLDQVALPPTMVTWCQLAFDEIRRAASELRSAGIPVPVEVGIPGFTRKEWCTRRLREAQAEMTLLDLRPRLDASLPGGVLETIVRVARPEEIWLFGSRARGTARSASDWDLLVVLPDDALDDDGMWARLRDVRRSNVDLSFIGRDAFEVDRSVFGTLSHIVVADGRLIYAR